MSHRNYIAFSVNQTRYEVSGPEVFQTAADFLRYQLGLTGTKIVCAEGDCGACTILTASIQGVLSGENLRYQPVNSCIIPLYLLDCHHVITIEGLKQGKSLHPVQEAMIQNQGAQCGYCTPGIVCTLVACAEDVLQAGGGKLSRKKASNYLTGNLCRCTGYEPILEAATQIETDGLVSLQERYHDEDRNLEFRKLSQIPVHLAAGGKSVSLPVELDAAVEIKNNDPKVRVMGGGTDLGVLLNKGKLALSSSLSLQNIPDLYQIKLVESELWVGARVSLRALEEFLEDCFPEKARLLRIFASLQIKNQGTLVGNVVNGSPIGDTLPYLMIAPATVHTLSVKGARQIPVSEFYLGYKDFNLLPTEIVTGVTIQLPSSHHRVKLYKVSLRKDLDISSVTFAGSIAFEEGRIAEVRFAYGGVGPVVIRMNALEKDLIGKPFARKTFEDASREVEQHMAPLSDLRGSKEYRLLLCRNLLLKFFDEVHAEMGDVS